MSTLIQNCQPDIQRYFDSTVDKWGKDQTGLISYNINPQGFRSKRQFDQTPDVAVFGNSCAFGIGVPEEKTCAFLLGNCHNYGLAGIYDNGHSIKNLQNFLESDLYKENVQIIFFWIHRQHEDLQKQADYLDKIVPNILHINFDTSVNQGHRLLPQVDDDASGTHPGVKTHEVWAKLLKLLIADDRKICHS